MPILVQPLLFWGGKICSKISLTSIGPRFAQKLENSGCFQLWLSLAHKFINASWLPEERTNFVFFSWFVIKRWFNVQDLVVTFLVSPFLAVLSAKMYYFNVFFSHSSITAMRGSPTFELFLLLCSLVVLAYATICLGVLNLILVAGHIFQVNLTLRISISEWLLL